MRTARNRKSSAGRLSGSLALAACVLPSFACGNPTASHDPSGTPARITLDATRRFQTISGWEATCEIRDYENSAFERYKEEVYDLAVNDLGINRLRLEVKSGVENTQDYATLYRQHTIDKAAWRANRYANVNDNADPFDLDPSGFHFTELDMLVETIVLPIQQRLRARGERLYLNVNYVAFTRQIKGDGKYIHDDPEEYAEFALAVLLHLREKYALAPDGWEVILEPDNVSQWTGERIGQAIAATARRLAQHDISIEFIAPSTTSMGNAIGYFDEMIRTPGVMDHLAEFSYHRYRGVSQRNLEAIADRARSFGLRTGMLEHMGSGYDDLHADLKIGMNSAWQQYVLAFPGVDKGASYYVIDDRNPSKPVVTLAAKAKFLRQYFKFIRAGAVRIDASSDDSHFDPLAFVNPDSRHVVVVKATRAGSFAITGLPAGRYAIKYTTATHFDVDLPEVRVGESDGLVTSIPAAGVLTVYGLEDSRAEATDS